MEKRVEVEINGKKLRVLEHLVPDMMKFGASLTKRSVKEPPRELLNLVPKKVVIPAEKPIEKPVEDFPAPIEAVVPDLELPVKVRKTPVRSKAKK